LEYAISKASAYARIADVVDRGVIGDEIMCFGLAKREERDKKEKTKRKEALPGGRER
jgi:hypothetical protein